MMREHREGFGQKSSWVVASALERLGKGTERSGCHVLLIYATHACPKRHQDIQRPAGKIAWELEVSCTDLQRMEALMTDLSLGRASSHQQKIENVIVGASCDASLIVPNRFTALLSR